MIRRWSILCAILLAAHGTAQAEPFTVTILADGRIATKPPQQGATFVFRVFRPDGTLAATKTVTGDAAGQAAWSYTWARTAPPGLWAITVVVTANGTTASGWTTFAVSP